MKSETTLRLHSPGNDKEHTTHSQVGQQDVDPDVRGHGLKEGEEPSVGTVRSAVQDADPCVEEWLGEVNHLFPHKGDGKGGYSQICSLSIIGKKDQKFGKKRHFCFVYISLKKEILLNIQFVCAIKSD